MTILAAQASLQAVLVTAFAAMSPVPEVIAWPNTRTTIPTSPRLWVAVDLLWGDAFVETVGPNGTTDVRGVLQVTLHAPRGDGTGLLATNADVVRDALSRKTISGVRCDAASAPVYIGTDMWMTATVRVALSIPEVRA